MWRPLPAPARWVYVLDLALSSAMSGAIVLGLFIGFSYVLEWDLFPRAYAGALAAVVVMGAVRGYFRWKHTAWLLDETGFRIRRGWLWLRETLVPRARVQHLDIERGPIERRFRLATLIVYTAGTSNSAVTLASLDDDDAVALRDALLPERGRDDDAI